MDGAPSALEIKAAKVLARRAYVHSDLHGEPLLRRLRADMQELVDDGEYAETAKAGLELLDAPQRRVEAAEAAWDADEQFWRSLCGWAGGIRMADAPRRPWLALLSAAGWSLALFLLLRGWLF